MSWETKSCTVFDVTGLTEVKMRPFYGWRGTYYIDESGTCIAKTCRACRETLSVDCFTVCNDNSSGYRGNCKKCVNKIQRPKGNTYSRTIRAKYSNRSDDQLALDMRRHHPDGKKRCHSCEETKPLNDFFKARMNYDGLYDICKKCSMRKTVKRKKNRFLSYWAGKNIPLECYVCRGPWEDADHVIAEKLGGSDDSHNRLPICGSCNSSKYSHPLETWLRKKHPDIADEVLHRVTVDYGVSI